MDVAQKKKSPRPRVDAVMSAGSSLDIAPAYQSWATMIYRFGHGTERVVLGSRVLAIQPEQCTSKPANPELLEALLYVLPIVSSLARSCLAHHPHTKQFTNNHLKRQERPKCQKLLLPFPTPREYNLTEMMSGVLDSRRNNHMRVSAKVEKSCLRRILHSRCMELL